MSRAQISVPVLLLVIIAVLGSTFYYAVSFKNLTPDAVNLEKSSQMFSEADKFEFYAKDFASFALQEAYAETAKKPVTCEQQLGLIPIWSACPPPNNQEVKNKIKTSFDEKFGMGKSEIKDKLNVIIEKNYSISDFNKIYFYNLSYNQTISFSLDYPIIDFYEIYSQAVTEKDKLLLDNWDVSVVDNGNYWIFTLNSKKLYLYENSFKPAELRFALVK